MRKGRPLNPQPKQTAAGTWSVEVPAEAGSRRRVRRTFPTRTEAAAWAARAVAQLQAGEPAPHRHNNDTPANDFATVAQAWVDENYVTLNRSQLTRQRDVEGIICNHLVPFIHAQPDPPTPAHPCRKR